MVNVGKYAIHGSFGIHFTNNLQLKTIRMWRRKVAVLQVSVKAFFLVPGYLARNSEKKTTKNRQAIIEERLGKQLGKGTGSDEKALIKSWRWRLRSETSTIVFKGTWMSQEVSRWLVNGLFQFISPTYTWNILPMERFPPKKYGLVD